MELDPKSPPISQDLLEKEKEDDQEPYETTTKIKHKGVPLLPLIFLIYFHVSGGPYGQEAAVGAGGPFYAIIGFIIFPLLWSVPEALVTAELATTFPDNGGFVIWTHTAFGPFWGYLMGSWKFLSGVINLASFPGLCIQYMDTVFPALSSGLTRHSTVFLFSSILSCLNYSGLNIVGYVSIGFGILSLIPFIALSAVAIPQIDPSNWVVLTQKVGKKKEWKLFFNTLFWNLNSWDSVSTLSGEIRKPERTLPKALLSSIGLTCSAYLVPLVASTGAMSFDLDDWMDGYYSYVAEEIAGSWLCNWMKYGAIFSGFGLFQAQLSSCSYQLQGMAELGILPRVFGARSSWFNTPWVGILVSASIAIPLSALKLENMRALVNFLYSLGMILEFAAVIYLRVKLPAATRPFKIPIGIKGLIGICVIPSGFLLFVLCAATKAVYLLSFVLTLLGVIWYFLLKIFREKMWFQFNKVGKKFVDEDLG
ncbi:hypothetical protein UlMin_033279 [Ulmus minor]